MPPAAVNRPEFRRPAGGQGSVPPPLLFLSRSVFPTFPRFSSSALSFVLHRRLASTPLEPSNAAFALIHNFDFIHLGGEKIQPGNSPTLIYRESVRNHFQIICLRITLFFCEMLFDSSPETLNLLQQSLAYTLYFRRKELWQ